MISQNIICAHETFSNSLDLILRLIKKLRSIIKLSKFHCACPLDAREVLLSNQFDACHSFSQSKAIELLESCK